MFGLAPDADLLAAPAPGMRRTLLKVLLSMAGTALVSLVLFSPAYVVAYALKGRVEISSLFFLVLLAVLTNGMLVNYATGFLTLLTAESRKGYVDTALVKNLAADWSWNTRHGVPAEVLWRPGASAPGHVFHHIYLQARYQHLPALKEHASFLITGLIIIEMALNNNRDLRVAALNIEKMRAVYGISRLVVLPLPIDHGKVAGIPPA